MKLSKAQVKQLATLCELPDQNKGRKGRKPKNTFGALDPNRDQKKIRTRTAQRAEQQGRDILFDKLCEAHGLPLPVHEYPFAAWQDGDPLCPHPAAIFTCRRCGAWRRRWRLDYVFEGWLAVEKEGGAFIAGRHVNGAGFKKDLEKYNEAALAGFTLLRFLPEQFQDGSAFTVIKRALDAREEQA